MRIIMSWSAGYVATAAVIVAAMAMSFSGNVAPTAEAHFVGERETANWLWSNNIGGWCGKPSNWKCDDRSSWVIVGWDWDHDGRIRVGDHGYQFYSKWKEVNIPNILNERWCEMYFRTYHYSVYSRYYGPACWG